MDSDIQLTEVDPHPPADRLGAQEQSEESEGFSLPPVDRGKDAWLMLLGAFVTEALVWGMPFSFGLFQEYYSRHEPFSSESSIATIGTTSQAIMYLSTLGLMHMFNRWPKMRRTATFIGVPTMAMSLVLASFAESVWHLILTQGILYGIGGTILYSPTVLFLDEWFVQRKGFAYGLMWAGTGVAGVLVPLVMNFGLERYGFRTMLRAWALVLTVIMGPLLFFLKPRLPVAAAAHRKRFDVSFAMSPAFMFMQLCNLVQSLGYFLPSIYLPNIGLSLGASSTGSTLTVILLNLAGVFGSTIIGALIDRLHVTTCMFIASMGASLAVFFLWGFSGSLPLLLVFSFCYGLTGGGFSTTWTGIIKEVQKTHTADTGLAFGVLAMGRGIGSLAAGPLSQSLLSRSGNIGHSSLLYGSQYGSLVVFTGVTAAVGASGALWYRLGWW